MIFAGLFGSNSAKGNAEKVSNQQRRLSTNAAPLPAFITKPPFPHPLPHTRLRVSCISDGIVISGHRGKQHPFNKRVVHIEYGTAGVTTLIDDYANDAQDAKAVAITCMGCLGVFKLFQETYLLVITSKKYVGNYAGAPAKRMYALSGVSAIPLSTQSEAESAMVRLVSQKRKLNRAGKTVVDSDTSTESSGSSSSSDSDIVSDSSRGDVTGSFRRESPARYSGADQKSQQGPIGSTVENDNLQSDNAPGLVETPAKSSGLGRWFWPTYSENSKTASSQLVTWSESASPTSLNSFLESSDGQSNAVTAAAALDSKGKGKPVPKPLLDPSEAANLRLLDARILKEALADLTSGGFFFSQDFDLTTCAQRKWRALTVEVAQARGTPYHSKKHHHHKAEKGTAPNQPDKSLPKASETDIRTQDPSISEPLCQRADRRFWYNRWLSKNLTDVGAFEFATVLMQGYVQRTRVELEAGDEKIATSTKSDNTDSQESKAMNIEMLVISRRSIERPGLRYQRRGVNTVGGVANFVETEFILSTRLAQQTHLTSYVQIRGSIPLYWTQSPWSLKPIPVLERQGEETTQATSKHFDRISRAYFGNVHIVNLAEQTGKEGTLVKAYEKKVEELARRDVIYNDWDFHRMCKGMRYERISMLLDQLERQVSDVGWVVNSAEEFLFSLLSRSFWSMDGTSLSEQEGVFRTNCMDCLDRTNVVQSAFARKNLVTVLEHLGVGRLTPHSQEALDVAFNNLWANNGDAISREYAGTSALKGDFVRSGKRNWLGQLNDATNSVSRYYQNTVLDFFKQALIDYILGTNPNAFLQFSEKMQTSDPGEIARLASIRSLAIDTASSAVLTDGETKIHGWTLLSPVALGSIRDTAMEEKILLLTSKALYICEGETSVYISMTSENDHKTGSFEFTLQKVQDFVRIPLGQITSIQQGEYILSALDSSARNIEENYGFCLEYLPEGVDGRSRTYSVRNNAALQSPVEESGNDFGSCNLKVAFKALRKDFIRDLEEISSPVVMTSRNQVLDMVDHIRHACEDIGATTPQDEDFVKEAPIVSLEEAKTQVGLLDKLNYELKNMIWL